MPRPVATPNLVTTDKPLMKELWSTLTYTAIIPVKGEGGRVARRIIVPPGASWHSEEDHKSIMESKLMKPRLDDRLVSDSAIRLLPSIKPGQLFAQSKDVANSASHLSVQFRNPDRREEKRAEEEAAQRGGG